MIATPRCANVFVLVTLALVLHSSLSAQSPTPIRQLEIDQTSAGPAVRGMFSPLEHPRPDTIICGTCHCTAGSNDPGFCSYPYRLETLNSCPANNSCNYQQIVPYGKGMGCVCLCTINTGTCNGCSVGG
jgi:hypothetical protein